MSADPGGRQRNRYLTSLVATVCLFGVINILDFERTVACCDFIIRYGVPFPYFETGGFGGIRHILWLGAAADAALVFAISQLIAMNWALRRSMS